MPSMSDASDIDGRTVDSAAHYVTRIRAIILHDCRRSYDNTDSRLADAQSDAIDKIVFVSEPSRRMHLL